MAKIVKDRKAPEAPVVDLRSTDGKTLRGIKLSAELFGVEPNVPLMHQVVNAQLAARRAGTQSTKTRAEVAGGGAKPWRQKGTGRARAGSLRAPNFSGGGVALGPKPRSYAQNTPKKMIQGALASALSDRASEGKIVVVDKLDFDAPSTKGALQILDTLGVSGSTLVVLADEHENAFLSLRNVQNVHVVHVDELNAYDVLRHDFILFVESSLPGNSSEAEGGKA